MRKIIVSNRHMNNRSIFLILLILIVSILFYWYARPNSMDNQSIMVESWDVVKDGSHNAFTDLTFWNNSYYLTFRKADNHISHNSRIILLKSEDLKLWETIREFSIPEEDIRDPKFAHIEGKLFIYVLKNKEKLALPYSTMYTYSEDGEDWSELQDIMPVGWAFWRPKTWDNITWYVSAYSADQNISKLYKSLDGINWQFASDLYEGEHHSEDAISFVDSNKMVCTIRVQGSPSILGNTTASTLIGTAELPYTDWTFSRNSENRLDGPVLFNINGFTFAAGRFEPDNNNSFRGGLFKKKRTSLFLILDNKLIHLFDLPSSGDTSYPGVVIRENKLFISYYSSNIHKDFPWIMGQFFPTNIRIGVIDINSLLNISKSKLYESP